VAQPHGDRGQGEGDGDEDEDGAAHRAPMMARECPRLERASTLRV